MYFEMSAICFNLDHSKIFSSGNGLTRLFPFSKNIFYSIRESNLIGVDSSLILKPFPNKKFLDSSKLKETEDDNFKFDENGRKFSKREENTVGNGEIARYEQFLLFPQCFQKTCTADT